MELFIRTTEKKESRSEEILEYLYNQRYNLANATATHFLLKRHCPPNKFN